MKALRLKPLAWPYLIIGLGILGGIAYSSYLNSTRLPADCIASDACIDIRSIGNIEGMLIILLISGLVAASLAVYAVMRKQPYSKITLGLTVTFTIIITALLIIG